MPNLVFANYGSDGNQILDPNSKGNSSSGPATAAVASSIGSGAKFITHAASGNTNAGGGVGRIIDFQQPSLGKFIGAKLVYFNWDTAAPMQINAVKVAPCASDKGAVIASNWSDFVTFNGATTAAVPTATIGIGTGGSGPGLMPNIIPGITISDFVAVESLARVDTVGATPLLRVRTHVNDNSVTTWASFAAPNLNANGLKWATGIASGAVGTLTSTGVALGDALNYNEPVGVIFVYADANIKTLAVFGDSLSMGAGAASNIGWPGRVTTDWYNSGGPIISAMNFAESSQVLEDSHAILRAQCALHKPTYCAMFAYSPNSANRDAAGMLKKWTMVLQSIDFLESRGIKPILMTSTGVESLPGDLPEIIKSNNRVKSLAGRVTVIDGASLVFDFVNNLYFPAYKADVTHYNDAGHILIGKLVYDTLKVL